MNVPGLIEIAFVTRADAYSDGRQYIEARGIESDTLYCSERGRYDRQWQLGDEVAVYHTDALPEATIATAGYREVIALAYLPPGEDAVDPSDRALRCL